MELTILYTSVPLDRSTCFHFCFNIVGCFPICIIWSYKLLHATTFCTIVYAFGTRTGNVYSNKTGLISSKTINGF